MKYASGMPLSLNSDSRFFIAPSDQSNVWSDAGSVPRAVASVAPSVGPLMELRSLPLAVLTRPQASVNELLNALPFVSLARVDVAIRIHGDAAHAVELAWHASAHPEARHDLKRIAPQDEDL